MATRLYYTMTAAGDYPAEFASEWEYDVGYAAPTYRWLLSTGAPDAAQQWTSWFAGHNDGDDVSTGQWISEPLSAQLLSGTIAGLVGANTVTAGAVAAAYMVVRAVSGDCDTIRATLYTGPAAGNLSEGTKVAVAYPAHPTGATFTDVQIEEGDRIVVELGWRRVSTYGTHGILYGAKAADSDLSSVGQAAESGRRPWIEFSGTLWAANSPLGAEALVSSGGTGEIDVTGGEVPADVVTIAAISSLGADLDVYEPVPVTATATATHALGGDLVEVVFLGDEP